jgi:hypothetical protein
VDQKTLTTLKLDRYAMIKKYFDKVVAWDRNLAKKIQDKFNLTDYQMLVLSFGKGFVIGALLL